MQTSSGAISKTPLASGGEGNLASNPSLAPPPGSPPGVLRGPPPPAHSPQPAAEPQDQLAIQLALLLEKITLQDLERQVERDENRVRAEETAAALAEAQAASAAASAAVQAQLQQSADTASASAAAIAGLTTSLLALKEEHELLKKKKSKSDDDVDDESEQKPFCPHYPAENPHAEREKFRKSEEPALFIPANKDETWDLLLPGNEPASAAGWEYKHRTAECSFLKDIVLHCEKILPRILERLEDHTKIFKDSAGEVITAEEDSNHLVAIYNSVDGVYTNLTNRRCSLLQLKALLYAKFPGDKNKEKRETLLQILEDETYGVFGGILPANTDALFAKAIETYKVKVQDARVKKAASVGAGSGKPGSGNKPGALGKKVTMQPKAATAE
jgi:hypothetical protein